MQLTQKMSFGTPHGASFMVLLWCCKPSLKRNSEIVQLVLPSDSIICHSYLPTSERVINKQEFPSFSQIYSPVENGPTFDRLLETKQLVLLRSLLPSFKIRY